MVQGLDGKYGVSVFCASTPAENRKDELYGLAARFGEMLARAEMVCINGGSCGMMQHVSRGAYQAGGMVRCVGLERWGFDHEFYTDSELLLTLRARQNRLIDLANGFVALPGGVGTDYEVYEVLCLILAGELPEGTPLICLGMRDFRDLRRRMLNHIKHGRAAGYKVDLMEVVSFVNQPDEAIDILKAHRERLLSA